MSKTVNVLAFGDIVGRSGRAALKEHVGKLRNEHKIDLVIANGENAAGGLGIQPKVAKEIFAAGVDVITLGDHTWQREDVEECFELQNGACIRPANYPPGAPGKGWCIIELKGGVKVGVFNLLGRVFMSSLLDCPFRAADTILENYLKECRIKICDFHAEATSEKIAMGRYLDGRCSLLFGTHTHVQTADEEIFPNGTAYITDLGMCGPSNGVLGMKTELSLKRFLTGRKVGYELQKGEAKIHGIIAKIDSKSGKAMSIKRVKL